MAKAILVEGLSGTGKSTAWRNVPHEQAMVIRPNTKDLPFPGSKKKYKQLDPKTGVGNIITTSNLTEIPQWLKWINQAKHIKYVLTDDFTHYMSARTMSKDFINQNSGNAAFAKWNVFGSDVYAAMFSELPNLREDLTIVFNHHVSLNELGEYTFKSQGKLLENIVDPVSYFTYVFHTRVFKTDSGREYKFQTNRDGIYEAKTPMGCFEDLYIDNDMYAALQQIEKYELGE